MFYGLVSAPLGSLPNHFSRGAAEHTEKRLDLSYPSPRSPRLRVSGLLTSHTNNSPYTSSGQSVSRSRRDLTLNP